MVLMADIQITGTNAQEVLNSLTAGLEQAMIKISTTAGRYAMQDCPVDTGRLRASITSDGGHDDGGHYAQVGSNVEYAPYVELGARGRAPVHFLTNSIQEHLDEYKQVIIETLKT